MGRYSNKGGCIVKKNSNTEYEVNEKGITLVIFKTEKEAMKFCDTYEDNAESTEDFSIPKKP